MSEATRPAAQSIPRTVAAIMADMGVDTIGRTVGLDRLAARVQTTHPSATRSEIWDAAVAASNTQADPEDKITFEDCARPAWGDAGDDC